MNVIEINGVKKRFEKSGFVLDLPYLAVEEGYVTGFIGENGSGKTTTIKLLMDMLFADEGEVKIFGKSMHQQSAEIKQQIGYVGSSGGFIGVATLKEIRQMTAPFYKNWDEQIFLRLMDQFSLDPKKQFRALSSGQQKQFMITMALSSHPKLLILDEPTANLDPFVREEILDLLAQEMQNEGMSVFFSTHITSDLDKIADYIKFLHRGKLLLEGDRESLIEQHRVVKGRLELLTSEVEALLMGVHRSEFGFTGLTAEMDTLYPLLGEEVIYEKTVIEDIFLGYTKQERGTGR